MNSILVRMEGPVVKAKRICRCTVDSGYEKNDLTAKVYAEYQRTHCNCIVCGTKNPISLGLNFVLQKNGSVTSEFRGSSLFQGYSGILHGGIIATLLDATMTHCLFHIGIEAVTGDLQVRYLKPVPFSSQLKLRAKVTKKFTPLFRVESEMTCDGKTVAWAKAKFMEIPPNKWPNKWL